jgi:tRNA-2-methylthio-N6-dimethylallyladenosine synthase
MFSFVYSPRPLTEAATFTSTVDPQVARERLQRLQARHNAILDSHKATYAGEIYRVYFDTLRPNGRVSGRTDNGRIVTVTGSEALLGQCADVRITQAMRTTLEGELVA